MSLRPPSLVPSNAWALSASTTRRPCERPIMRQSLDREAETAPPGVAQPLAQGSWFVGERPGFSEERKAFSNRPAGFLGTSESRGD
eukprot:4322725-Pyramimonas_sp.AAC.2